MRGAKQRQAMRMTFRNTSPTKGNLWSKEEQEKRDKETAEWEKGPEEDKDIEALTQTGEEKEEDVEMTQEGERATAIWMEEGRNLLEGKQRREFTFLGKEGRKEKELVISAVHSHKCKWDAQTMNLPPIDIGVPEEQKYKALRTQITQQVERLGCKCYVAFEERRMRKWLEEQGKQARQAWVIVMDSEDPRPSDEKIITIFFTKHDQDCKWRGKGEIRLNPIRTEKRGGDLKREVAKKTNAETEAQGCKCDVDFDTMENLETEMMMNQGVVNVVIYEEPEEGDGLETSQWNTGEGQIQVKATQDGHDTQSQALPRSRTFTGAKTRARKTDEPPPFQAPPEGMEMNTAMEYVIKTMTGVAARSEQMYKGYLDRVAEKEQMMREIKNEVRNAVEELRKEIREEIRQARTQEWSGKRKQIPLPPKPGPRVTEEPNQRGQSSESTKNNEEKVPTPPEVVIVKKKKEEEKKREAARGEKKYVAPLPGYDDSNTSSSNTPLWSKVAATKGEWTTVTKKQRTETTTKQEGTKKTPEEAIRGRNIIIERPKAHKSTRINEQALRDSINGAIRATAATARITLVKITGSGNIAIRTDEEHTAEDIWIHKKRIEATISKILQHAFELRKDYEREFIKVDSIKLSYANGGGRNWSRTDWNSTTLHALRTDLELSNRGIIVMERPQFIGSLRRMEEEGRTTATGVFAVAKTQELKDILKKGKITLAAKEHNCRKWDNEPYTTICEKCLERGHSKGACGGPAKCKYCGGRHMSENHQCKTAGCDAKRAQLCRHHPKKCTKCGSNQHFGDDPNCSFTPTPTPEQRTEEPRKRNKDGGSPEIVVTPASPDPQQERDAQEEGHKGPTPQGLSPPTNRGRKRTQTEEQPEQQGKLGSKTKEQMEKERRAFNERMRKKTPEDETHAHAWCTHKEEEKKGYCTLMEGLHFSHFLTGNCRGAEEDGAATCPEYPKEDLEQVEEELINWEEFLKTPTPQTQTQTPTAEQTVIITKDGHTVIDGEPSPSIAFPSDHPHENCHCDPDYEKNMLKADCTDIEGICKCYHRTSDILMKLLVSGDAKIRRMWRASSRISE